MGSSTRIAEFAGNEARPLGRKYCLGLASTGLFAIVFCALHRVHAVEHPIPRLQESEQAVQFVVDGKPQLILGGELGNSTSSHLDVLDAALDKCVRMHLNTVLLPVAWDRLEPEEGRFDFALVQGAIDRARSRELRLMLLWFGTWKNSMSCYAPGWVKRDAARFPRARNQAGEPLEIISPACDAAAVADARAFAALMKWLKEFDAAERTVIAVQVENEVGMIPDPRDYSAESERAYRAAVPPEIASGAASGQFGLPVQELWRSSGGKSDGAWRDLFGSSPEGNEIFTAWQLSTFVEVVAAAGKREYPLPMFVNAALIRPGYRPGEYPSAGPLPHLSDLWSSGAPSIDLLCPDVYFPNFMEWCDRYAENGAPLFIPEMAASVRAPGNVVFAIARHHALGCAPFAIETLESAKESELADCYAMLAGLAPQIMAAQRRRAIIGLSPQIGFDWSCENKPQHGVLGGVRFEAMFDRDGRAQDQVVEVLPTLGAGKWDAPAGTPLGAVMILESGPDEFLVAGRDVTITFAPATGPGKIGIESAQEGRYAADGNWVGGRWLNGDQTHQGRHIRFEGPQWTIQRVALYRYK